MRDNFEDHRGRAAARKGKAWCPVTKPRRQRATYNRHHGVMHMLAALDLATGKVYYRIRDRKRHREFLDLLKALRARWAGESSTSRPTTSPRTDTQGPRLVRRPPGRAGVLPTYGSWLNWIEAEFAALRYFALNGTDHRSHNEQNAAVEGYIRWRNTHAQPKTRFATDSPIRTWTHYPTKVA